MADLTDPNTLQNIISKMQAEINDLKLRVVSFNNAAEAMGTIDGTEAADGNVKLSENGIEATDGTYLTVNQWFGLGLPSDSITGDVRAIAYDSVNNCVYVAGSFTQIGNCVATNIAKYDIADKEWSAIGGSLSGSVECLLLNNGILYVGGRFTDAAGLSTADYIAAYNTSAGTWASIGGSLNSHVYAMVIDNGILYVGGAFTNAAGISTADYIAAYNISGAAWSSIGGSLNEIVNALAVNGDRLIVGGHFTGKLKSYSISGRTWTTFTVSIGGGTIYAVASNGDEIYFGGRFAISGFSAYDFAKQIISTDTTVDVGGNINASGEIRKIIYHDSENLLVGGDFVGINGVTGASMIARYNISSGTWLSIGGSFAYYIRTIELWGKNFFVGGTFDTVNDTSTRMIALYVADLKTALDMLNRYCVPIKADGSSVLNGRTSSGERNLVLNGDMRINQRAATSVASITASGYYTVDGWYTAIATLGTWTQSVENDAPTGSGFRKSLKMLCTSADASPSAGDYLFIRTPFEGQDLQHLLKGTALAKSLTLTFWVKSNLTGTYIANLLDYDSAYRSVSAAININAADVWEKKTVIFPADTTGAFDDDNALSLVLGIWLAAGSDYTGGTIQTSWGTSITTGRASGQVNLAANTNNYIQVTGFDLKVGAISTDYDFISLGEQYRRCRRYYRKSYNLSVAPGTSTADGARSMRTQATSSYHTMTVPHEPMRAAPSTIVIYSTTGASGKIRNLVDGADVDALTIRAGESGFDVYVNNVSIAAEKTLAFQYTESAEL